MADPWGIVVIPAAGDPGGLLAEGPCGALPPTVHAVEGAIATGWRTAIEGVWFEGRAPHLPDGMPRVQALPLWWNGKLVPEGWWRGWRAWVSGDFPGAPCPVQATIADCLQLAKELVFYGIASRVVLLDLVGGRLVERAP